jgi:cytochrome c oxidase subunit 3
VSYFNQILSAKLSLSFGLISLLLTMGFWWRDIAQEATLAGDHTFEVKRALSHGITIFIGTEILVFFSIFWAYFHSALSPTIEFAVAWPPAGIVALDATALPLFNTLLLLASGCSVTFSHHALVAGNRWGATLGLVLTLVLATIFTLLQANEYVNSSFTFADGVYGSSFYLATGTHGFHVCVGTLFLLVGLVRVWTYALTDSHHKGLENAIVYWHMVDVVWLFLYGVVYWWA